MSVAAIQALLASENFGDRLRALNEVRALPAVEALPLVLQACGDANTRVRYAAVSQVASLGTVDLPRAAALLRDRLQNDPEPDVQAAAADAIGALKLTEAYPELEQLYRGTSEWLVQFSIIAALGELGDGRAFELLREALDSEIGLVQTAALTALGELGDRRAVDLLVGRAGDEDWQVRHRVAQALNHFRDEAVAIATLSQLQQDENELVAAAARGEA
mgnify:CR=1 FL=1